MGLDVHFRQQVAVGRAAGAHIALPPDPDTLSVVHTGGNLHAHLVGAANLALALAGIAGGLDDFAPAAALGTGGGGLHLHAHEVLNHPLLTGTPALGTGFNIAVGTAGAVAGHTVFNSGDTDLLVAAEGRFLESQVQPGHDVLTPAGAALAAASSAAAAAEQVTEDVTQVTEPAEPAKAIEAAVATGTAGRVVGIHAGKAVLIIPGPLFVIGQHLVGLAHFLELLLGFLVAGVPVGMVFHGCLSISPFDFIGAGALLNAQHLIVITLVICHLFSPQYTTREGRRFGRPSGLSWI